MKRSKGSWRFVYVCGGILMTVAANGEEPAGTGNGITKIKREVIVNATIAEVWHAWTTNEGIQTFFSQYSNVKLEIGGPFEILFDGKIGSNGCKVLSFLPKEMFSFSWSAPPQFEHARKHLTWVVLRLERLDDKKVLVKLTHLGWDEMKIRFPDHAEEWNQVREYFAKAWPNVLDNLKKRFETGPRWG